MALPVSLKEVAGELQGLPTEATAYINRRTGKLSFLSDEIKREVEQAEDASDLSGWMADLYPDLNELLESDDWLELPLAREINDYPIMRDFCESRPDHDERTTLLRAIKGRGAFRRFKQLAHELDVIDEWYAYELAAYKQIAADWLDTRDIPYVDE